ncbi:MAG TPA: hypothetical protein V6C46_08690 [Coleofasciculaceae cyanobacterium]
MAEYLENGIKVTLPDREHFRIQDLSTYKALKGWDLSEMDFVWWNLSKDTLWLIEVEDYFHLSNKDRLPAYLLDRLINKATDSLMFLSAAWFNSAQGKKIYAELPVFCQYFPSHPKRLKLVFVLKITEHHLKADLGVLKTRLSSCLRGRVSLFDLKHITLTDHETAQKMGLPIKILEQPDVLEAGEV